MAIGSDPETTISRGDERPPKERKTSKGKKAPRIPRVGMGTTGSNFSDNTSKYLGSVYTEYVREMDEPVEPTNGERGDDLKRQGESSDLAVEMQHEFNMKLAETIQREHDRDAPVYAEVRAERKTKTGRSYNGSYKSDLSVSEDIDATIDAAFKSTFEDEDRHISPVMGTEAILEKKKKREQKDKERKVDRKKERRRGEKDGGPRKVKRSEPSIERRVSKDSETTIEASHHITVEVILLSHD